MFHGFIKHRHREFLLLLSYYYKNSVDTAGEDLKYYYYYNIWIILLTDGLEVTGKKKKEIKRGVRTPPSQHTQTHIHNIIHLCGVEC